MRQEQINFLFLKADELMEKIKVEYEQALKNKNINNSGLKIDILFYLVCLRVALDYLAQDIKDVCNIKNISSRDIYFPIRKTREEFEKLNFIKKIKGNNYQQIFSYLFNIQPFPEHGEIRSWLGMFNSLVNHNKHDSLTPHLVTEQKTISILGHRVKSITVGAGSRLVDKDDNLLVMTSERIDYESVEKLRNQGVISDKFKKEDWASISFEGSEDPIPVFLNTIKSNVFSIFQDINKILENL